MATQLFHTHSTDVTWLFIGSSSWTAVEVNIGIMSGNLLSVLPSGMSRIRVFCFLPPCEPTGPQLPSSPLTRSLACLPSLRPILLAIFGDSAFTTSQQVDGSKTRLHADNTIRSGQDGRTKVHRDSYMRVGGGIVQSSGRNEGSRDILVRHDVSIVAGKREE